MANQNGKLNRSYASDNISTRFSTGSGGRASQRHTAVGSLRPMYTQKNSFKSSIKDTPKPSETSPLLRFWTIYTPPICRLIQTAHLSFDLNPFIRRWLLSLYFYIAVSLIIVRYNLLQVQLSLVDAHLPSYSLTSSQSTMSSI